MTSTVGLHSTETKRQPILSIRARLILLALIGVVPLLLDRVHLLETDRAERIEAVRTEAMDLARRGAENHAETIQSAHALLQLLARMPAARNANAGGCRALAELAVDTLRLRGLSIVGADGRAICPPADGAAATATPQAGQPLIGADAFSVSDYLIPRGRTQPTLVAAYPQRADDGTIRATLLAMIDVTWIERLSSLSARRPGVAVALLDRDGRMLTRYPAPNGERPDPSTPFADVPDGGVSTTDRIDGIARIAATLPLPGTQSRLVVGLDRHAALHGIEQAIDWAYVQLAVFALALLVASWFGGEQLIVEPIRKLAQAARRLGHGELEARLPRDGWLAEFTPLAQALDDMAQRLGERERELRAAKSHFEQLASIDALSGLANRRAFDLRMAVEWRDAAVAGRPIGLLLFDVDHFKRLNDMRGHLEGDACLRLVAAALASVSHDGDFAARFGGDEFALLMPGAGHAATRARGDELCEAVRIMRARMEWSESCCVTVSVGTASRVPVSDDDPTTLIASADGALYAAKRLGRDRVVCASVIAPALAPELPHDRHKSDARGAAHSKKPGVDYRAF